MSTSLRFTVMTPDRMLLGVDSATKVRVKLADDAWLSVYPNHAPLIAEILSGPVYYDTEVESGELSIAEGILQVSNGQVTILTSGYRRESQRETSVPSAAADVSPDLESEVATVQQFDRLARQLLMALQAQPESVADEISSAY